VLLSTTVCLTGCSVCAGAVVCQQKREVKAQAVATAPPPQAQQLQTPKALGYCMPGARPPAAAWRPHVRRWPARPAVPFLMSSLPTLRCKSCCSLHQMQPATCVASETRQPVALPCFYVHVLIPILSTAWTGVRE